MSRAEDTRRTLRLLLLDDDEQRAAAVTACLETPGRERLELRVARSVAEACAIAGADRFDGVLLRHRLGDGHALAFLEECEQQLLTTPVVGLDRWTSAPVVIDYTRAGCLDFLDPGEVLRGDVLRRRLSSVISRAHRRAMATIIERQELANAIVGSQEQLISMARTDPLTGIANRAVFDDLLPVFHDSAIESGHGYAVVMIDVDRFKAYNDHFGHPAGDEVLRSLSHCIAAQLREEDFVARYGGEELVVLLHEVGEPEAWAVADRIRSAVERLAIAHAASIGGVVTISAGIAVLDPDRPAPRRALLLAADAALYEAKRRGRNRIATARRDFQAGAAVA